MLHTLFPMLATLLCVGLQQVPPLAPVKDPAAEKLAQSLAQTSAVALNHDLGLLQRLDLPFPKPLSFKDASAIEVLKAIRVAVKAPIELDTRALGDSGGWELKTVSCEAPTPRQALDALLRAISPDYEEFVLDVAAGIMVITDSAGQRTMRCDAQYPMVRLIPRMSSATTTDAALRNAREELEDFLALTRPSDWESNGGDLASIVWTGPVATIRATPSMHHDMRKRLAQLELSLPTLELIWTASVLEIAPDVDDATIDRLLSTGSDVDALVKSGKVTILAAPRFSTKADEQAQASLTVDGVELVIRVEPIASPAGRSYVVRLRSNSATGSTELALRALAGVRAAGLTQTGAKRLFLAAIGQPTSAATPPSGAAK